MDEELVKKKIGKKEVDDAYARLQKYKAGKAALETRIVGAEEWWKNNHWQRFNSEFRNAKDPVNGCTSFGLIPRAVIVYRLKIILIQYNRHHLRKDFRCSLI